MCSCFSNSCGTAVLRSCCARPGVFDVKAGPANIPVCKFNPKLCLFMQYSSHCSFAGQVDCLLHCMYVCVCCAGAAGMALMWQ